MKNLAIALGVFTGLFAFTCIILMAVMLLVSKKKKDKKVITREEEIPESTDDRVSIFCLFRFSLIDVVIYCWKIILEFKKKKEKKGNSCSFSLFVIFLIYKAFHYCQFSPTTYLA